MPTRKQTPQTAPDAPAPDEAPDEVTPDETTTPTPSTPEPGKTQPADQPVETPDDGVDPNVYPDEDEVVRHP